MTICTIADPLLDAEKADTLRCLADLDAEAPVGDDASENALDLERKTVAPSDNRSHSKLDLDLSNLCLPSQSSSKSHMKKLTCPARIRSLLGVAVGGMKKQHLVTKATRPVRIFTVMRHKYTCRH